ncbi:MAG: DHH family phosphoesterase [Oscillospiraceae bacterium]|nr:DHH family phosphoesterase [Oscillospiraceae bacterium]
MKKNTKKIADPSIWICLGFMALFAVAALIFKAYILAACQGAVCLVLGLVVFFTRHRRERKLKAYIESITYDTENAKNSTLMNFPMPIAVFQLSDSRIIWGNEEFFQMCGSEGSRMDACIADMVPEFTGSWLLEGKTQYPTLLELGDRKYRLHGHVIRSGNDEESEAFMGITYWVDMTEYDSIRVKYENTRPVAGIVVIDNLDELYRNQPDRVKNDIRDAVEDRLRQWCEEYSGILRRYDRDRYLVIFEKQDIDHMKEDKFRIIEEMHQVESPSGIGASISIGFGADAVTLGESLQFADVGIELAISRGGDQTVIKDRLSFEFFGGRGFEVEKRTKVKSRVMANTLAELVRDSSKVYVMGHRFADLDSVGAAVGVCCLARNCGVKVNIVIDPNINAAHSLIDMVKAEPEYRDVFISCQEAMARADSRTLLVIVDTNRPEQVEDADLLSACNRVAVIDHHRVAATYIQNAALGFIEPYASSASELITEVLQELLEQSDLLKCEAEALLAGIVLDTKSFTLRTGDRTFDAAAFLRRAGADTSEVKKLLQTGMEDTVARYKILQSAELYKNVAIAAPSEPQNRIVAAQAADELLNISGVEASIVIAPDGAGGVMASARSIGELNVQILMEKLGGGGNRSAAAVQFKEMELPEAVFMVYKAIDDYFS